MKKVSKRKIFIFLCTCFVTVALFALFEKYYSVQPNTAKLTMKLKSDNIEQYQVYYDTNGNKEWSEENSIKVLYTNTGKEDKLSFALPIETKNIRIDFGNENKSLEVKKLTLKRNKKYTFSKRDIEEKVGESADLKYDITDTGFDINVIASDPYIEIENISNQIIDVTSKPIIYDVLMMLCSLVLGFIVANALTGIKKSIKFIKVSIDNKGLIKSLAKNDFRNKYASSYLGIVWGFINPLITILVYWFVFTVGFRSSDVGDAPYTIWFIAGIIPWFFFSDALNSTSNVFLEYSYLVKKVVFKIEILPTVKIISALFVHLFFVVFIYALGAVYGYYPDLYSLQFIYYSFAMIILVFCISLITSSVILFFRDLGQIIGIILNIGFWATPIGWTIDMLPGVVQRIFKLNPMYYIVTGYRDSFIDKVYFWERPYETLYFWAFCLVAFCFGVKLFKKLKPHFSDVI